MKQCRRAAGLNKEDIMEQYKQEFIDFPTASFKTSLKMT